MTSAIAALVGRRFAPRGIGAIAALVILLTSAPSFAHGISPFPVQWL